MAILCAVGHNTGHMLDFGEKTNCRRGKSPTHWACLVKVCTFLSSPAPPTGLRVLAPYPEAHNVVYAFSVNADDPFCFS